jgi:hypothetical protein
MFVDLNDRSAFADAFEIHFAQANYLAEHQSKKSQLFLAAIRINAIPRIDDKLPARSEHQFLFGAAYENVHALRVLDESESVRPDECVIPDETGDHNIGFATLETVACIEEFAILTWAFEAEEPLGLRIYLVLQKGAPSE